MLTIYSWLCSILSPRFYFFFFYFLFFIFRFCFFLVVVWFSFCLPCVFGPICYFSVLQCQICFTLFYFITVGCCLWFPLFSLFFPLFISFFVPSLFLPCYAVPDQVLLAIVRYPLPLLLYILHTNSRYPLPLSPPSLIHLILTLVLISTTDPSSLTSFPSLALLHCLPLSLPLRRRRR